MEPFTSSSSLLRQLPDYVNLWSRPPPPHLTRPASPPRRNANSMIDARTQAYMVDLEHNAMLRASYHHSTGSHLPSRAGPSSNYGMSASGADASMLVSSSLSSSASISGSGRVRPPPARSQPLRPWWGNYKDEVKLREAIESGNMWSGSGVTDEEERALTHQENLDMDTRSALLTYGRSTLTILGRGRTMQEDVAEQEDREAYASNFPNAAAAASAGVAGAGPGMGSAVRSGPDPRAGAESRASANPRSGSRADGTGRAVSGGGRTDHGDGTNGSMGEDEGNVNPHAGQDPRSRGSNDNGMEEEEEEDAVFEGEYTLEDGRDDDIVDAYHDDAGGEGAAGAGTHQHGHQGGGDFDLDLDAGIQSMD